MAGTVKFAVSATPTETPTVEQGTGVAVIATEVGKSFGGGGSVVVGAYDLTAANQGYLDATVNYKNCVDDSWTAISAETTAKFVFIKNTGYLYSSTTALGAVLADHLVAVQINDTTIISTLNANEAIILKAEEITNLPIDASKIKIRTYAIAGGAADATDHLAVEYLSTLLE